MLRVGVTVERGGEAIIDNCIKYAVIKWGGRLGYGWIAWEGKDNNTIFTGSCMLVRSLHVPNRLIYPILFYNVKLMEARGDLSLEEN